jgi:hypothetical protein
VFRGPHLGQGVVDDLPRVVERLRFQNDELVLGLQQVARTTDVDGGFLSGAKESDLRKGLPDFWSWSKHTKMEKYIPNDHKLDQKAVKYTEMAVN